MRTDGQTDRHEANSRIFHADRQTDRQTDRHEANSRIFHADRQKDMKLTVAFWNFRNAPKKLPRTCHEGTDGEQRYTPLSLNLVARRGRMINASTPAPTAHAAGWAPEPTWSFWRRRNLLWLISEHFTTDHSNHRPESNVAKCAMWHTQKLDICEGEYCTNHQKVEV
jgi:hypothetical protein